MDVLSNSSEEFGTETRTDGRRILIDCSLSRFDGRPTGIPRVTLNYVRYGLAFGQRSGIGVVPVELTPDGLLCVRTLPEEGRLAGSSAAVPRLSVAVIGAKIGLELLRYIVRLTIAVLALLCALVPSRSLIRATNAVSHQLLTLRSNARAKLDRRGEDAVYVNAGAGDVVLCPSYWHDFDPEIYETLHARGAEICLVLHDIAPVTYPAYYDYPWRWKFEQRLARSLEYVTHYYCVSNKTRLDLTEFAAHRQKTIQASVAYNGFEPSAQLLPASGSRAHAALLDRRPWLMVGSLEPKKGYRDALAAFEALWAAGYQRPLLVVGGRGWMYDDIVETLEASRWLGDRLFWLDSVGDDELANFYRRAYALLFASYAEGFGLPLIEAASHGLPILARDMPTAREILGSHATFFADADQLIGNVKFMEDPATLEAAREKIERLVWFDWRSVVDSVLADILRRPEDRRTGTNLLDRSLMLPVRRAAIAEHKNLSASG